MTPTLDISDPRAAAVFASHRQRQIVLALIPQERSLGELSRLTGMPLNLLHHHIAKLLKLGLVRIAGTRKRAGTPVKLYRAAAEAFFVPAELAGKGPGDAMAARMREALEQGLAAAWRGTLYSWSDGGPRMRLVKDPAVAASCAEFWCSLRLNKADAVALIAELDALLTRYRNISTGARGHYLVHAALAPL